MGGSSSKLISDPSDLSGKKFDYVIIGGGTAGCVLASRLSEDPSISVLLIEAGKSNAGVLFSQIPLAFPKLLKCVYARPLTLN
jgi:choline dehydrogenase